VYQASVAAPRRLTRRTTLVGGLLLFIVVATIGLTLWPNGSADALPTCDKTWTGDDDDEYTNGLNWSPTGVPTATQYACAGPGDYIYFEDDNVRTVRGVNIEGGLEIVDGELRIGTTANGADESVIGELVVSDGRRGGKAPLTVTDSLTMYGGRLGSPNSVGGARGGVTTVPTGASLYIDGGLPLDGEHTLRVEGDAYWTFGGIEVCDASVIENVGTFELPSDGSLITACGGAGSQFVNMASGTVTKLDTGSTAAVSVPFENHGTVVVAGDTLAVGAAPGASSGDTGAWQVDDGAILEFTASRTFAEPSFSGGGTVAANGGTQTFAAPVTLANLANAGNVAGSVTVDGTFFWAGGSFTGAETLTLGATSTSSGAGTLSSGYTLANHGQWSIGDVDLLICDGSTLRNHGTVTIQSNARSIGDCGAGPNLFENAAGGTVSKAAGIESFIDVPFTNAGTLSVSAGRLLLVRDDLTNLTGTTLTDGTYDLAGFLLVTDAAGGITTNAADLRISGAGQHLLDGGGASALTTLTTNAAGGRIELRNGNQLIVGSSFTNLGQIGGVGTLDAPTVINSGTIAPGLSPGILTIDGDFQQTSGGILEMEFDGTTPGTGHDQLVVTGSAALGGTLQLVTGFSPAPVDTFTVLTAASRTSGFAAVTGSPGPGVNYVANYNPTNVVVSLSNAPALPTVSIADASMAEGSSGGTTNLSFTVSLDTPSALPVSVQWATADGTAQAPGDYTASSGTVTFDPSDTSETITVPVVGDTDVEPDETFLVNLSAPVNAIIGDGSAIGTILNDDVVPPSGPTVSIGDAGIWEGDSGVRSMLFPVTLDMPATETVSVRYRIVPGTATGGKVDLDHAGGAIKTLKFKPAAKTGQTVVNKTISVKVFGDTEVEGDETFTVELVDATGLTLGRSTGQGTIYDDEGVSGVRVGIGSVSVVEGDGGTVKMTLRLTLSEQAPAAGSVRVTASNGSAVAGVDFKSLKARTVKFAAGSYQKGVVVTLLPNTIPQGDRSMQVALSDAVNFTIQGSGIGVGTILDDD
jgi:hypothetical protein